MLLVRFPLVLISSLLVTSTTILHGGPQIAFAVELTPGDTLQFEACTFEGPAMFFPGFGTCGSGTYFVPVSQAESCLSSFQLDPTNVTQYLESLITLTRDYYVFTDVAVDPLASIPDTTPLDYPIYNGTGHGQVDLIAEMMALYERVNSTIQDTVSLDIFSEVNEIYAKLYDTHVIINLGLNTENLLDNRWVLIVPDEAVVSEPGEVAAHIKLIVGFPTSNDLFVLANNITYPDGSHKIKVISTIDGKEPMEFLKDLALQPTGIAGQSLKSLGPRVQNLIQSLTNLKLFFGRFGSKPSKFLKDSYFVTYTDGSETNWNMMQAIPCPVSWNLTREDIQYYLNQPGELYQNYQNAVNTFTDLMLNADPPANFTPTSDVNTTDDTDSSRSLQEDEPEEAMMMDHSGINFTMFGLHVGIAVMEDYAIYKVDSFHDPGSITKQNIIDGWVAITEEAAAKGVTKLIFDVIGNEGGVVGWAYTLANLMYPNANWADFGNPYDQLFSPALRVYWEEVSPLLDQLNYYFVKDGVQTTSELPDLVPSLLELLNKDPELLLFRLQATVQSLEALVAIAPGRATIAAREAATLIQTSVLDRTPARIKEAELILLLTQIWYAIKSQDAPGDQSGYFALTNTDYGPIDRIRGGKTGNYSSELCIISPDFAVATDSNTFSNVKHPYQFQQYLLLGDGNGIGSSANTFQTTVSMYAKTNPGTVPPLDLVSYGGTGQKRDSAVTQFAGGSVQQADLSPLYIPDVLLFVIAVILDGFGDDQTGHPFPLELGSDFGSQTADLFLKFDETVPNPCYYCDKPPQVTVYEMYSVLVGANSTPLEYVNQVPDHHISQWPFATSFSTPNHLPSLYDMTSSFFGEQTPVILVDGSGGDATAGSVSSAAPTTTEVIKSANKNSAAEHSNDKKKKDSGIGAGNNDGATFEGIGDEALVMWNSGGPRNVISWDIMAIAGSAMLGLFSFFM